MKPILNTIIIDDEPRARRVLNNLLSNFCEGVQVKASCKSVQEAVKAIKEHKPEMVFCDIEMPGENGFELFKYFDTVPFEVIFTTGYSEYALKAFEVSAVDYLLKPIEIEKLESAVNKVRRLTKNDAIQRLEVLESNLRNTELKKLILPTTEGTFIIPLENILYFKADGAYTFIYKADQKRILASKKLGYFEQLLEGHPFFFRTHRSFLVNTQAIGQYTTNTTTLYIGNNHEIPIARDRRKAFAEFIHH